MSEFSVFSWVLTIAAVMAVLAFSRPSQRGEERAIAPRSSEESASAFPKPSTSKEQFQRETFEQLQMLLVNYPSAVHMATQNPDLPARNLVALFRPLESLLQEWGYEAIGKPWQAIAFDPQLHQPDASDIQPGETVYVRFIGYRNGADILCPAKVSRSLPQISSKGP